MDRLLNILFRLTHVKDPGNPDYGVDRTALFIFIYIGMFFIVIIVTLFSILNKLVEWEYERQLFFLSIGVLIMILYNRMKHFKAKLTCHTMKNVITFGKYDVIVKYIISMVIFALLVLVGRVLLFMV
jgi:ABC-type nickel/cobalt efflux system permease component RcnA